MPDVRVTAEEVEAAERVYREGLDVLCASGVPFLVGGAYAFAHYTGIQRFTKDFDVFIQPADVEPVLQRFAAAGFVIERPYPHWLAKARRGDDFMDLIYSSGNGVARVDEGWFEHAVEAVVLGRRLRVVPLEEMLWSKSFIMERERYDGADVVHLLRARAASLDWKRLLGRFGGYWRVLFSHVVLFGFVYPGERASIPQWVLDDLIARFEGELRTPPADHRVCQGTILSREQYLHDVERWGYHDARVFPRGHMSADDTATWTAAIGQDKQPGR
ncbi:MAG TPA: hypothetical protein VK911_03505 [Vicinamibacterales bacterium]|nr:hypothetical protein [Vicinamibacterales bacterium]